MVKGVKQSDNKSRDRRKYIGGSGKPDCAEMTAGFTRSFQTPSENVGDIDQLKGPSITEWNPQDTVRIGYR